MRKLLNEELDRKTIDAFKQSEKFPIVVVLDNVRSMNNVGSVFRTADAFLIEAVYLCGITGTPPHRDIQKTALGSTESVTWKYYETTLEAVGNLKFENYKVYSVEQAESAIMLDKFQFKRNEKIALVFGSEVGGVDQEVINKSDGVIEIPQYGTKHSLNISVSVGVVVWDAIAKIQQAKF